MKSESEALEVLSQICPDDVMVDSYYRIEPSVFDHVEKLREISSDYADLSFVTWGYNSDTLPFNNVFNELITEDGLCRTFNMLDVVDLYLHNESFKFPKVDIRSNWTVQSYEDGYTDPLDFTAYPMNSLEPGKRTGMSIRLKIRKNDVDYGCKGPVNGFSLTLHTPDEFPQTGLHSHSIPFGRETSISVQPYVMSTSENLKRFEPKKRQCFFEEDKKLKYFKSYTQSNCKLECLTGKLCFKLLMTLGTFKSQFCLRINVEATWVRFVLDAA